MAREATASLPTLAGRERAVPATKSFTAQLLNLYLLALMSAEVRAAIDSTELGLASRRSLNFPLRSKSSSRAGTMPCARSPGTTAQRKTSSFSGEASTTPSLARALEAQGVGLPPRRGYPSGELKHVQMPWSQRHATVMIANGRSLHVDSQLRYEKVVQLMRDMRAQGASVLAIANLGDDAVGELASHTVYVEECRKHCCNLRGNSAAAPRLLDGRQQWHRRRSSAQTSQSRPG